MHFGGSKGFLTLVLFLVAGALLGSMLGSFLETENLTGILAYLCNTYELFNLNDVMMNLGVLQFHFGLRIAPNLMSIIGLCIAAWLFNRF